MAFTLSRRGRPVSALVETTQLDKRYYCATSQGAHIGAPVQSIYPGKVVRRSSKCLGFRGIPDNTGMAPVGPESRAYGGMNGLPE